MLSTIQMLHFVLAFLALFCSVIVLVKGKQKLPMIYLSFTNIFVILIVVFFLMLRTEAFYQFPHFLRVPAPFLYLLGPTAYLFTRTLFYKESSFRKTDWLHFLPFFLHFVELIPFYLSDAAPKIEMLKAIEQSYSAHLVNYKEGLIDSKWHTLLKVVSVFVYYFLSVNIYLRFKKKIKTDIIVDYNRIFSFTKIFLITRLAGIFLLLIVLFFLRDNQFLYLFLLLANMLLLVNTFVLIFVYPEFIFGEDLYTVGVQEREDLVKTLMSQSNNLKLLHKTSHEANILLSSNYRLMYFNKEAEIKMLQIYGKKIELHEDFRKYLDPVSTANFERWFNKCQLNETVHLEEKFLTHDNSRFTWMQIDFTAHYNELGKLQGVSVGVTDIDEKKRMTYLQQKYVQRLDELAWDSSHLLRAPVANMKGIVNLIGQKDIQLSKEEKEQLISHMSDELDDLDNVIRDMVGKARKELEK